MKYSSLKCQTDLRIREAVEEQSEVHEEHQEHEEKVSEYMALSNHVEMSSVPPALTAPSTVIPLIVTPVDARRVSNISQLERDGIAAEDLLDVILDPLAPEHEWIHACHELDRQNRRRERQGAEKKLLAIKQRRRRIWIIGVATLLFASVGIAAHHFHWWPFHHHHHHHKHHRHYVEPAQGKEIDFGPYMEALQKEIKSHWQPPKVLGDAQVKMHFRIHKTGEITDVGFDRLSALPDADAAALKSIIESMPNLSPLPAGAPDFVDIGFTFESTEQETN